MTEASCVTWGEVGGVHSTNAKAAYSCRERKIEVPRSPWTRMMQRGPSFNSAALNLVAALIVGENA